MKFTEAVSRMVVFRVVMVMVMEVCGGEVEDRNAELFNGSRDSVLQEKRSFRDCLSNNNVTVKQTLRTEHLKRLRW